MHLLQEKIKVLQNENKRLWQQQKREDASYKVLYCVSDRIYLEKPYWDMSGEGFKLKANSPLLYHDACIQYNLFTFVVYRYYSMDEWAEAESTDGLQQNGIPDPAPTKEVIKLVSEDMKEALTAFMKNKWIIRKTSPGVKRCKHHTIGGTITEANEISLKNYHNPKQSSFGI